MKKKILTLFCALAVSLVTTVGCAANRLLPNLKKQDGLTTVYVGKTLIRMAGCNAVNVAPGLVDMDDIVKYLDSVEIVNADSKQSVSYLRPIMESAMKSLQGLDLAMEVKEDDQTVNIYTVPGSSPDKLSRILITVTENDELTLIDMQGDIPANMLEDMNF